MKKFALVCALFIPAASYHSLEAAPLTRAKCLKAFVLVSLAGATGGYVFRGELARNFQTPQIATELKTLNTPAQITSWLQAHSTSFDSGDLYIETQAPSKKFVDGFRDDILGIQIHNRALSSVLSEKGIEAKLRYDRQGRSDLVLHFYGHDYAMKLVPATEYSVDQERLNRLAFKNDPQLVGFTYSAAISIYRAPDLPGMFFIYFQKKMEGGCFGYSCSASHQLQIVTPIEMDTFSLITKKSSD